jgi:3-hydroxy acid dehydrogenase / malonic semialdehyde reductase
LSKGGANVILIARRADALSKVSDACVNAHKESGLQQGGKFASVQLDVSDKHQIASLWTKVPQDLRNVDILGKSIHLGTLEIPI